MAKKNKNKVVVDTETAGLDGKAEVTTEVVAEYTARTNDDGTATVISASEDAPVKAGEVLTGEAPKADDADAARQDLINKRAQKQ